MRTTLNIHDGLYADIKKLAKESNMSVSALIHDFLLESFTRRENRKRDPVELPVYHGTGTHPGVDITDIAGLLAIMEDDGDGPA
ncbi:MAG: hypothetical protein F4X77_08315 [Acidobacteriia bacterium]|nr:hypothetical protein [Terriglobia bacterium]